MLFKLGMFHFRDFKDPWFVDIENYQGLGEFASDTSVTHMQSLVKTILSFVSIVFTLGILFLIFVLKKANSKIFYSIVVFNTILIGLVTIPSKFLNVHFITFDNGPLALVIFCLMIALDLFIICKTKVEMKTLKMG